MALLVVGVAWLEPGDDEELVMRLEEGAKEEDFQAEDLYDLNPKEGTQYCENLWNDAIEK
ncbi:hypothetical protein L7F22_059759, partial [Adiantum nelumboides]|nr:hypothetical protein [Adiantum nelumboides]